MQDGTNTLRLFEELRLHPWTDEDKRKIDAQLAYLYVSDKVTAERYQKLYDQKMLDYIAKRNAESGVVMEPTPELPPITTESATTVEKKPRKKKTA